MNLNMYENLIVLNDIFLAIMIMPSYFSISDILSLYFLGGAIGVLATYLFKVIVDKVLAVYSYTSLYRENAYKCNYRLYVLNYFFYWEGSRGVLFLIDITLKNFMEDIYYEI